MDNRLCQDSLSLALMWAVYFSSSDGMDPIAVDVRPIRSRGVVVGWTVNLWDQFPGGEVAHAEAVVAGGPWSAQASPVAARDGAPDAAPQAKVVNLFGGGR